MIFWTSGVHDPQPVDARVQSRTACRPRAPPSTASTIRPFETALQSQICARVRAGRRLATGGPGAPPISGNNISDRFEREHGRLVKGLRQPGDGRRIADDDRASDPVAADDQLLVDAAPDLRIAHDLVVVLDRLLHPHHGEIDARDLQLRRRRREPA